MARLSDKKTLQGLVQPWRCDCCQTPFEPDLKGICAACGRLLCPEHRAVRENPRALGGKDALCPGCAQQAPGGS
jgi:hypothetical protein